MKRYFTRTNNSRKNAAKAHLLVLLFVLAHAVACFFTHNTSFGDGLILTCLTIAMVYFLIRFYDVHFEVFLGLAFLSCFAGFYIGTQAADLLYRIVPEWGIWINVIITSLVTETLGLVIILLLRRSWNKKNV